MCGSIEKLYNEEVPPSAFCSLLRLHTLKSYLHTQSLHTRTQLTHFFFCATTLFYNSTTAGAWATRRSLTYRIWNNSLHTNRHGFSVIFFLAYTDEPDPDYKLSLSSDRSHSRELYLGHISTSTFMVQQPPWLQGHPWGPPRGTNLPNALPSDGLKPIKYHPQSFQARRGLQPIATRTWRCYGSRKFSRKGWWPRSTGSSSSSDARTQRQQEGAQGFFFWRLQLRYQLRR